MESLTFDGYLTFADLVAYSGLSKRTLQSYLHHPVHPLPYYQIERKILVKRSDFDAWAKQFRVADAPVDIGAINDAVTRGEW